MIRFFFLPFKVLFFFSVGQGSQFDSHCAKEGFVWKSAAQVFPREDTKDSKKKKSPNQAVGSCACPSCCCYRQLLPAHPEVFLAHFVLAEKLGNALASACRVTQKAL